MQRCWRYHPKWHRQGPGIFNIPGLLYRNHLATLRLLWYSGAVFIAATFSSISSFCAGLGSVFLLPTGREMPIEYCCSLELWAHRWILKASALILFLFIYAHKVDHCAEGTVNSKAIAVKEDLPQTVLITSEDGNQGSTSHGSSICTCSVELPSRRPLTPTPQPGTNTTDLNLATANSLLILRASALLLSS